MRIGVIIPSCGYIEMKKLTLKLTIAVLAVTSLVAQQRFARERLMKDLAAFTLSDWQQREAAFYDIVQHADPDVDAKVDTRYAVQDSTTYLLRTLVPDDQELLKKGLIGLLQREAAFENLTGGVAGSEEFSEYVVDVATSVMTLRDQRSIPALLAIVIRRGPIDTIAAFGEPAVQPTLDNLARTPTTVDTEDEELRMNLTLLLNAFLRSSNVAKLRPESVAKLKNTFRQLAVDPSAVVREHAITGLAHFQADPEIKALLTHLAQNDPDVKSVREAARAALASH
jgi:HEAT repeats